jgi:hypothetical protein
MPRGLLAKSRSAFTYHVLLLSVVVGVNLPKRKWDIVAMREVFKLVASKSAVASYNGVRMHLAEQEHPPPRRLRGIAETF